MIKPVEIFPLYRAYNNHILTQILPDITHGAASLHLFSAIERTREI